MSLYDLLRCKSSPPLPGGEGLYQELLGRYLAGITPSEWGAIVKNVRDGKGVELYPIGTEFAVAKTVGDDTYYIVFVVRDHDHYTMANPALTHSMALETKYVYGSPTEWKRFNFDAQEALYFASDGLEPGPYSYVVKKQAWYPADNNVAFYFTLTQPVPAGGQLVTTAVYNQSMEGKQIRVFDDLESTVPSETVSVSSEPISGAVNLGATDGNTPNVNFLHRIVFGSNNYRQSNLRQWLNSNKPAGSYYTPQTVFDRPGAFLAGTDPAYAGFQYGLDPGFLAAVKPAIIPYRTNNVFEVDSLDGAVQQTGSLYDLTTDKFFLLSRPEVFGSWDSADLKDGTQLQGYVDMTASELTKYDAFGTARIDSGRSPNPTYGHAFRGIGADGAAYIGPASYLVGATVACVVA